MHDAVPLLTDHLAHAARRLPEKIALVCQKRRVTYGELDRQANALANAWDERGIEPGDRVLIFADNTVEAVIAFWAALKANAVVCVVNPLTKVDKLSYLLNDCRAKVLVTDSHLSGVYSRAVTNNRHLASVVVSGAVEEARLQELPGGVAFEAALATGQSSRPPARRRIDVDLAAIIYTSGSTGDPKGVMLTHRNMLTAATSVASYLGYCEQDVICNALPLSFDYGLYQMIMGFRQGARLVLERSFIYPAQVLHRIKEEAATVLPLVPTMAAILGEMTDFSAFDLGSVRTLTNTAAALSEKHIASLARIFPNARLFSMYGLTECKRCTYLPPQDLARKAGSVGIAIPNTEVWIVDEAGERAEPGAVGELVVRGATVMAGYWEKPEATARRLKPGPLPGERLLYTGDFCRQDEEGYVYFVGRKDDIIKSRGEKVAPKEVEAQLNMIHGVKECAVIGVPDEILGQAVKAFIVLERGARVTEKQLRAEAMQRLESFMVPKHVQVVDDLPKTTTGKIKKTGLT